MLQQHCAEKALEKCGRCGHKERLIYALPLVHNVGQELMVYNVT